MPKRIKVSKPFVEDEMLVFFRKNNMFVKSVKKVDDKMIVDECSFEDVLDKITCEPNTPAIPINDEFWTLYQKAKEEKKEFKQLKKGLSIEQKRLTTSKLYYEIT